MHFYIATVINWRNIILVILTVIILPDETCADGKVNANWMRIATASRVILIDLDDAFSSNSSDKYRQVMIIKGNSRANKFLS